MLEKTLNLTTTKSLSNMNLFTSKNRLKKYKDVYAIVHDYYNIRLLGYHNRKKHLINKMEKQLCLLTNRARFILEQCEDIIDLRKKKKDAVIALLKERNYDTIDGDEEFKYLRTMRIEQVEEENVEKLVKEKGDKLKALEILKNTPVKKMWKKELKELLDEFGKYQKARAIRQGLRKK
jgi:DNA topoisomerase-2